MTMPFSKIVDDLESFPLQIRGELHESLFKEKWIPAARANAWMDMLGVDVEALMRRLLPLAACHARCGLTAVEQGAVVLGISKRGAGRCPGDLYFGANLELFGPGWAESLPASAVALHHAWLAGEEGIQEIVVDPAEPNSPAPDLAWMHRQKQILTEVEGDSLMARAHLAAQFSHAPQTQAWAGAALLNSDGRVYVGRFQESASLRTCVGPMHSAAAFLQMHLPPKADFDIQRAVLVEAGARISHQRSAADVLLALAPQIPLEYHLVQVA